MIGTIEKIRQWLYNQDKAKLFQIKEYKGNKTDAQRRYAWELITQIANEIRISKEKVYLNMVYNYSQSEIVSMLSSVKPKNWFKYYEPLQLVISDNKEFIEYRIYKGMSELDKKEMMIFIDGVIQEAEQLGIPTLTNEEIERLGLK